MSATVTCTPAAPAAHNFCRIDVAGGSANTATGYDDTKYPSEPEVRYYLTFEKGGATLGKSYVFGVDPINGDHTFNNYAFPSSGSWTVRLNDASNDSSVATASVTVS